MSIFSAVTLAPADPILGTALAFRADPSPSKVNLGIGAYRDNAGSPIVFESVRLAEQILLNKNMDKEYTTIDGSSILKPLTQSLLFGSENSSIFPRIASVQTLSGTGALRVGGEFARLHLNPPCVLVSDPSWETHRSIFGKAGIPVKTYPYWDAETRNLNLTGFLASLNAAPTGSLVLLHACAHNPTGLDPSEAQWLEILQTIEAKGLVPFVDCAYQGFASGDLDKDAWVVRHLLKNSNTEFFVAPSFAKNMGLYGERMGMLHVVTNQTDTANKVLSQLKLVIRPMYSSPPLQGARIVETVLGSPDLRQLWVQELRAVADRIGEMRVLFKERMEAKTGTGWGHVTNQIGMFSYTGVSEAQVEVLIGKWHIYMLKSGRISLAGLNHGNIDYVVEAFADVVVCSC